MNIYTPQEQQDIEAFFAMSVFDIPDHIPIANAVATLALSNVQSRLPQCGVLDEEGRLTLTRKSNPAGRRDVVLLPQHLFTINWADTGPGISWLEAYFAIYLPIIDRYVVTASMDCPDMWGVTDLAIGSFDAETDLIMGSGEVISAWWAMQRDHDQERFAYVWTEGRIVLETANQWADQVWSVDDEEEDE